MAAGAKQQLQLFKALVLADQQFYERAVFFG